VKRLSLLLITPALLVLLAGLATGCAQRCGSVDNWARGKGGVIPGGADQARAQHLARPLVAGIDHPITITILDSPAAGAWTWPDGRIFLTRGLLALADDQELSAAIAHELGHLLADGHATGPTPVAALRGCSGGCDGREAHADELGIALLRQRKLPIEGMPRLLGKLAERKDLPADCRAALRRRIDRL
jgi:Zn-dependent protease with chaperone function